MNIVGLIPLYKPSEKEVINISKYINDLDYCILLDDSGSSNESLFRDLIDNSNKRVIYYLNSKNMGLSASVNNGYVMANDLNADWVLIMNPDGTFKNNAISIYKDYILKNNTSDVAIIAPRFNLDRRKREEGKGHKYISYADMSGCLYNTKIFNTIGFYDNNTYFYGLDTEMCLRVKRNDYKIVECSQAVLNHQPGQTYEVKIFGKTLFKCGKDVPQRFYYQFRSAYYINKKYHSLVHYLFHIYKFLKVVFLFDNKKEYFKMINLGIKDAKREFYGNINDREN